MTSRTDQWRGLFHSPAQSRRLQTALAMSEAVKRERLALRPPAQDPASAPDPVADTCDRDEEQAADGTGARQRGRNGSGDEGRPDAQRSPGQARDGRAWPATFDGYVEIARDRQQAQDVDGAWTALKAADRQLLWTYSRSELDAERARIRREAAEKLKRWRRKFILDTLPPALGSPQAGQSAGQPDCARWDDILRVAEARRVLDEGTDNKYRKITLLRENLFRLAIGLLVSLALVLSFGIIADRSGIDPLEAASPLGHWATFLLIAALGAVGATLSALFSAKDQQLATRIPETVRSHTLLLLRPLIGAASALIIVLFLQSGIAGMQVDPTGLLIAAVAAGFTERAATRALLTTADKIQPKASADDDQPA